MPLYPKHDTAFEPQSEANLTSQIGLQITHQDGMGWWMQKFLIC